MVDVVGPSTALVTFVVISTTSFVVTLSLFPITIEISSRVFVPVSSMAISVPVATSVSFFVTISIPVAVLIAISVVFVVSNVLAPISSPSFVVSFSFSVVGLAAARRSFVAISFVVVAFVSMTICATSPIFFPCFVKGFLIEITTIYEFDTSFLYLCGFGISLELHQNHVESRDASQLFDSSPRSLFSPPSIISIVNIDNALHLQYPLLV
mmetsp:Transcript_1468/g.3056  ORF Transcript_1468/g.3056 Transcript_1468/m.3056 type:complete len:210 (-) Transcript_1468:875-1504(-)